MCRILNVNSFEKTIIGLKVLDLCWIIFWYIHGFFFFFQQKPGPYNILGIIINIK